MQERTPWQDWAKVVELRAADLARSTAVKPSRRAMDDLRASMRALEYVVAKREEES